MIGSILRLAFDPAPPMERLSLRPIGDDVRPVHRLVELLRPGRRTRGDVAYAPTPSPHDALFRELLTPFAVPSAGQTRRRVPRHGGGGGGVRRTPGDRGHVRAAVSTTRWRRNSVGDGVARPAPRRPPPWSASTRGGLRFRGQAGMKVRGAGGRLAAPSSWTRRRRADSAPRTPSQRPPYVRGDP